MTVKPQVIKILCNHVTLNDPYRTKAAKQRPIGPHESELLEGYRVRTLRSKCRKGRHPGRRYLDGSYAARNKSNRLFQSNVRTPGHGMVMKTGGRYRRDNIPRGRVSRSRRCQRRQVRPRRRRIVAAKPTLPRISRILSLSARDHTLRVSCKRTYVHVWTHAEEPISFIATLEILGNTDDFGY